MVILVCSDQPQNDAGVLSKQVDSANLKASFVEREEENDNEKNKLVIRISLRNLVHDRCLPAGWSVGDVRHQ